MTNHVAIDFSKVVSEFNGGVCSVGPGSASKLVSLLLVVCYLGGVVGQFLRGGEFGLWRGKPGKKKSCGDTWVTQQPPARDQGRLLLLLLNCY